MVAPPERDLLFPSTEPPHPSYIACKPVQSAGESLMRFEELRTAHDRDTLIRSPFDISELMLGFIQAFASADIAADQMSGQFYGRMVRGTSAL